MASFKCEKYPSLRVVLGDGKSVRFSDGRLEADGDAAKAVRALPDEYGVAEEKSSSKPAAK